MAARCSRTISLPVAFFTVPISVLFPVQVVVPEGSSFSPSSSHAKNTA